MTVNDCTVQGYKYPRAYIATQGPLEETVGDMWRMMWEFKSKVMVMLCNFSEEGTEACHPFWPTKEGDSAKYGKITVTFQSESSFGDFTTRRLFIEAEQGVVSGPLLLQQSCTVVNYATNGSAGQHPNCMQVQTEGMVVTQFHLTEWPEHGRPASTGSLVEMLDMITKAQMNSGNRAITVLCK